MKLNHSQLLALEAVSRLRNFTKAAAELHLTQPALSRRIQALEGEIGTALLARNSNGLEITSAGARVLEFAKNIEFMERELWQDLGAEKSDVPSGTVRIAGYSSVLHIVATPAIGPILRKYSALQVHYQPTQDIRPLARQVELLKKSESDFLIAMTDFGDRDVESHLLGNLELVLVESKKYGGHRDTFLDTRPEDPSTEIFLSRQQKKIRSFQRSFLHDEEGILCAVAEGFGRAVVYSALTDKNTSVRRVKAMKPVYFPVYLHYKKRPYYSKTMQEITQSLLNSSNVYLKSGDKALS